MTERSGAPFWASSPSGILTMDGRHYHTTEADLDAFAPDVLQRYGMESLLRMAGSWAQLPTALALLSLLVFLPMGASWQAAAGALVIWLFLSVTAPSVVFIAVMKPVSWLSHPVVQGLLFVLVLSTLAASGNLGAVWMGLAGFVVFRWQLPDRLLGRVVAWLRRPVSPLLPDDAILRNLIVRLALKHGYDVGGTDRMQKRVLEIMNRHRKPRK